MKELKPVFFLFVMGAAAASFNARAAVGPLSIKQSLAVAKKISDQAKADEEETALEMRNPDGKRQNDCCFPDRAQKGGDAHTEWPPHKIHDFVNGGGAEAAKPAGRGAGPSSKSGGASGLE